jgi:hypothetical protein
MDERGEKGGARSRLHKGNKWMGFLEGRIEIRDSGGRRDRDKEMYCRRGRQAKGEERGQGLRRVEG